MEPVRAAAETVRIYEGEGAKSGGVKVAPANQPKDRYDFYRCARCFKLITLPDEMVRLKTGGGICPCGSLRYSPANPKWWEYLLPRVVKFAWWRWRGVV